MSQEIVNYYKPDIARLQAQGDVPALLEALHHPLASIRQGVADALLALNAYDALDQLEHALRYETDEEVRAHFKQTFDALNQGKQKAQTTSKQTPSQSSDEVQGLITKLMGNRDRDIIIAAQMLGELGDKLAVEPLVMRFRDARLSIQVRLAVAEALLKLESAPVEVTLLATLRHTDWHIRRNGAAILGQLKAEWAIHPLFKALSDAHPVVRRTAQAALKHIGTPEARKALAWHAQQAEKMRSHETTNNEALNNEALNDDTRTKKQRSMLDRMGEAKKQTDALKDKSLPPSSPLKAMQDDDTHSQAPNARTAPPLNRDVLPDMSRADDTPDTAQPRSIHEERKRRTQQLKELTDTDRLRHSSPTAPLNPDVFEEAERRRKRKDSDET